MYSPCSSGHFAITTEGHASATWRADRGLPNHLVFDARTLTLPPLRPRPTLSSQAEGIRTLREPTRPNLQPLSPLDSRSSPRRPTPSPLHPSPFSAASSGPAAQAPRSLQSSLPYQDGPRSPREKLDALIAEEDIHTSAPAPVQGSPPTPPRISLRGGTQPAKPSSYAKLRNVSAPVLSSAGISPPASPVAMPPPSRPNRAENRPAPPRNPSIDSAASSVSSSASHAFRGNPNHAPKPSQDTSTSHPPDMAALIAAAGSPEAALLALWKEKQSASSHSTQLWRLVEKQRSMIIGLQKDLERSLKDKDRYRKKLKEYTNQVPPIPGAPQRSDTFDSVVERDESQSPAPSERQEDLAKASTVTRPAEHKASPLTQETSAAQLLSDSQLAQSPSQSSDAHTASGPSSAINSPTDYSVKPLAIASKGLGLSALVSESTPTVERPTESPKATFPLRKASTTTENNLQAPQLSLTQATPVIGGDGFEAPPPKPAQALRKAPPAPLNLSKPVKTSAHLLQVDPGENDDSDDYDDTLEVDEIPIVERGRRKTREEDDRVREAMAMKEDEARSKSTKKKKSESKSKSKVSSPESSEDHEHPPTASLSPRQFSPLQAGLPLSPRHPPANSLNALLSPTNSDSSMVAQRSVVSSPLMSPGLPTSPRPGDRPLGSPLPRNPKQNMASPPLSPRTIPNGMPPPATRAPRQPVPLPPNTPQSYTSPQTTRPEAPSQPKQQTLGSDLLKPPSAQPSPEADSKDMQSSEYVYRGLLSDQYPGLLLPPNALPSIEVKVSSSRLRPSRMSFLAPKPQEEDPVFHLAIYARSDGKQLWRMEKTIVALPALDAQLKSLCDFPGKLPDRALFSGHAPARVDARRAALNHYFDTILETPMNEQAALVVCEFFSTDVIGAQSGDTLAPEPAAPQAAPAPKSKQLKEGYLTKRGKNFGGWKARHFVLDGPEFRYYEVAGGAHLGTIKLLNAQIGKQSQQQTNQSPQRRDDSEDNQYRHAFLILEPKRKDSSSLVRHVLCAESDEERDAWVEALLQHVDWQEETSPVETQPPASAPKPAVLTKTQGKDSSRSRRKDSPELDNKPSRLQGLSYDDTIAAEAPMRGPTHREAKEAHAHSPKTGSFSSEGSRNYPSISGPSNGAPIQNLEIWGNKSLAAPTTIKDKKRSIFGFGSKGRGSDALPDHSMSQQTRAPERVVVQNRNVFGIPLAEAVEYTQPIGLNDPIPSVVYRSLEYLRAKNAISEEGIFRLSGSNIVIRALRERFNTEGDVKLLDGQYYDIHAVASLLKLYLRELPASILTRELHLDFLKVLDLDERSKKIQAFNVLVHKLPRVNFELLRHMSSFLIEIVDNAAINKMTVRNVGIVFAPTLNIPAPLISFFLTDFQDIFGTPIDEANSPIQEIRTTTHLGDEIRSPRHQMFSDIPTPAYNETSFQPQVPLNQQQWNGRPPSAFPMGNAPNYPPPQPPQQQQQQHTQYAGYDTGFIPVRPSYDSPGYEQQYQGGEGYGSLNSARQSGNAREQKQKRRESGMLLMNMGMGQRKGSNGSNPPRQREEYRGNPMLIREETAFD
ncbi:Rho GTPase activating protein [Kalmusia sp. IMI 367209]|nr:Rho GTPase activating protein [Kalmusia sp. IMI 367209]